ncbi:von Willebrand factor [Chryseobacterium indoltheticum]|uniref:von Willebrand factor n=1 Tax=Chryseobacterium indoltheticum TaxID=254 RepID=A0A381FQ67_9FLAO|nr:von Willebrand factor [Chryseobacterium indoltheticum]
MKKISLIIVAIAILTSCQKKKEEDAYAASMDMIMESPVMAKEVKIENSPNEKENNEEIDTSDEEYASLIENPFELTKNQPVSTFSIDVDNASYSNIRRMINEGQTVDKNASEN